MRNALQVLLWLLVIATPAAVWAADGELEHFTVAADDGLPLSLWAREVAHPRAVIVLIHGRTWSALPDFDLQVPGERRSVMQALNEHGYSAFALDLRGYGKSPRDASGWITPDRATGDVVAALRWLARERHIEKPALVGWSQGSLVSQLTAQRYPQLISSLVLYGYPRNPASPAPVAPAPATPLREVNTRERAASDFITPQAIPQKVIDAYVAAALAADPVRVDWRELEKYDELDPAKVVTPTLVIHGERDPYAPIDAQTALFTKLGTADRQWVVLPGVDHAALIENSAPAFVAAIVAFVSRPRY
ncbi:MAG TPA: alpha/beta fold hydrolase [Steroidobacteraceae bacterium]|jgi:pimeloyl-ACP methyl ester carboxylesterase|nr:alpha/beta fold hydrolase [Steroidobacteraceae bacterium]